MEDKKPMAVFFYTLRRGDEEIKLPLGYRFLPSDEDLLMHYLLKKILRQPLPADIIEEINIFDYDPHQLLKKDEAWLDGKAYYFVRTEEINQDNSSSSLSPLQTPSGYWRPNPNNVVIVKKDGRILGFKKTLNFYEGRKEKKETNWIMDEYKINMDLDEIQDKEIDDYLLYKVQDAKK